MPRVHNLQIEDHVHSEVPLENELTVSEESTKNERLLKDLSSKLKPVLKCLKMFGSYHGDALLDGPTQVQSSAWFSRFYCSIALLGQWTAFVQAAVSVFTEGFTEMQNFYFLLMFSIWHLQCAGFTTCSIIILSKRFSEPSRFLQFVDNLIKTATNFNSVKRQTVIKALTFVCCVAVFNSVCVFLLDVYQQRSVAQFRPWNGILAYRLIHQVNVLFGSFALLLPFLLFCILSVFLIESFDSLEKKIYAENPSSLNIGSLRKKHQELCETIALADKVFAPFMFIAVCLSVPLLCITLHQVIRSASSTKGNVTFVISVLYWLTYIVTLLAISVVCGIRINEKIHGFYDLLQNISPCDSKEHLELMHFLMHLRGEPIGLSVGGIAVIDKNLALSLVGIVISYFTVLVTLPS